MRREVVAQLDCKWPRSLAPAKAGATIVLGFWRELIFPARRIWAGLAAVWLVIFTLHFATSDEPQTATKLSAPPSQELRLVLKEQEALRAELLGEAETETPGSSPPKESGSSRRSERGDIRAFA